MLSSGRKNTAAGASAYSAKARPNSLPGVPLQTGTIASVEIKIKFALKQLLFSLDFGPPCKWHSIAVKQMYKFVLQRMQAAGIRSLNTYSADQQSYVLKKIYKACNGPHSYNIAMTPADLRCTRDDMLKYTKQSSAVQKLSLQFGV